MRLDKQTVVWTLGISSVTTVFLLAVTRGQFQRLDDMRTLIKSEQTELVVGRSSPQAIAHLKQEVEQLARHVGDYDATIPPHAELGSFLEELARFAHTRNVVQDMIEPGIPRQTDGIVALPITLRLRGPFASVYGFIQDIERMKRITQVERFASTVNGEALGEVNADLQLQIFYRAS